MTDLNKAFEGEDPAFMDLLFRGSGTDWRSALRACRDGGSVSWSWFWDRFAPWGCLSTIVPGGRAEEDSCLSKKDVAGWLVAAVALGVLEDAEPAAFYDDELGRRTWYWPLPPSTGQAALDGFIRFTGWRPLFYGRQALTS